MTKYESLTSKNMQLSAQASISKYDMTRACPVQEYTCQMSAYKPTEITHSVKIRGEHGKEGNSTNIT